VSQTASAEALRIVRSVEVRFPTGPPQRGSAFIAAPGVVVTCAHVAVNEVGQEGNGVTVRKRNGVQYQGTVSAASRQFDLARLDVPDDKEPGPKIENTIPPIGRTVIFAGSPQSIIRPAVFPGMVSDIGSGLIAHPHCEVIQIAGMINNGNSGGPLIDVNLDCVIGVITAKYVPLLTEINKLTELLERIPQFPSDVGIGQIDFAKFVNLTC
jgi:S1-C subfamily serine protease